MVAVGSKWNSASPASPDCQDIQNLVQHLQTDHAATLTAEVQHLHEMVVLGRMTELLGHRRTFEQVLQDTVNEAARIFSAPDVWVIEPDRDGAIRTIYRPDGITSNTSDLPPEVADLSRCILTERPAYPMSTAHYDPHTGSGLYLGLPIITTRHLAGVLVFHRDDPTQLEDGHAARLMEAVLRQAAVACENARLVDAMGRMTVQVVIAMAMAVESRDPYTGGHSQRVTAYALLLAAKLGLDSDSLALIRLGGLLHDIGKVAIPDAILKKTGKLTSDEYDVIKTHSAIGDQIVSQVPQLAAVRGIVRHHHERFDGNGYPDGLAATDIPLLARITAVADTFDAMTSNRSYRGAMSFDRARQEIRGCAATQFDPDIAAVFVELETAELLASVDQMHNWCTCRNRGEGIEPVKLVVDLDLPRVA
jgi:putative nucleotidyltransferase with HDIG domain